jgi:hypothetical protein
MHPGADDWQLAKRLSRGAKAAARAQLRAELAHAKAVRRRERKLRKARASLPRQAVLSLAAGLAWVPLDGTVWEWPVVGAAVVFGVGAIRSVGVLRSPPPDPVRALPARPAVPMPPPPSSTAFPYVRRLEAVRDDLRRLLPLVGPAGRPAGEEAWQAASEADVALRWQAARLAAVEPHRGPDPDLLRTLEEGVSCQERLVTAVADLVAASADPLAGTRLQDATDRLHGLAQGLREVR